MNDETDNYAITTPERSDEINHMLRYLRGLKLIQPQEALLFNLGANWAFFGELSPYHFRILKGLFWLNDGHEVAPIKGGFHAKEN